jgi:adenylylsulfate kinase
MAENVFWHQGQVARADRADRNRHKSFVLWFTGLSGAGKSTLAHAVEAELFRCGHQVMVLDGDNVRHGLCSDLGFSEEDRHENLRRIGEVSKLFVEAGVIVLAAFVSPYRSDRDRVRSMLPHGDFLEVYCKCGLETCEARDPKGLYARARRGEVKNFTGISAPYEEPLRPELIVETDKESISGEVDKAMEVLRNMGLVPADPCAEAD